MTQEVIDVAAILAAARAKAGLSELGDEDFLAGLNALAASMNTEVEFKPGGEQGMVDRFERILVNRLRFAADLRAHPDILDQKLLPPVVIQGLPRVGSTKLQRMLAASGSFQEPLFWQVFNPARPSTEPTSGEDPRLAEARAYVEWRKATNPAAQAAHHIAVDEVEEETFLLEFSFETIYPMTFVAADSYYEWIQTQDRSVTYGYLGKLLKYLQWQFHRENPRPWILKSPPNLGFEGQIERMAPGAAFIVSHRDPVTIVASIAALVKQSRRLYSASSDPHVVGRWALREFSTAMARHMAWRKANPDARVLDVSYADVEGKPMEVVDQVYGFLGLDLTDQVRASIRAWLDADRHGAEMRHEYSLEEIGLTRTEIEAGFAGYIEAFGPYIRREA